MHEPEEQLSPGSIPLLSACSTRKPPSAVRHSMENPKQLSALRLEAAEWLADTLELTIPHSPDAAFRAALADGTHLCQILNKLKPGTVNQARSITDLSPRRSNFR